MIVSNYTKLFSIGFIHGAYRDYADIMHDISIIPEVETICMMQGCRIYHKIDRNTLFCYVETISSLDSKFQPVKITTENKPLIGFNGKDHLRFKIVINSGRFLNSSNLRFIGMKNKIFRFGNDSGNQQNHQFYLSAKIPPYNSSDSYLPGMLVTAATRNYEAIAASNSADAHDTAQNLFWKEITNAFQYVNQQDLVKDEKNIACFGIIDISLEKNLTGDFSLLKTNVNPADDNTISGKDFILHFKENEFN